MRILLLLVLISSAASGQSRDSLLLPRSQFWQYDDSRKEESGAVLYSLIIPGAGHFYTDNNANGFLFLAAGLGASYWVVSEARTTDGSLFMPLIVFLGVRLCDIGMAAHEATEYNQRLRQSLQISAWYDRRKGPTLCARLSL